jgi:protein SMG7
VNYFKADRSSEKWSLGASNSCQFLLGMNVRWIVVLSRIFQAELQEFSKAAAPAKESGDTKDGESPKSTAKFSPFTENLLPLMRIYMAWLYIYRADIVKYQEHLGAHVFDMYRILAQALTTITKEFMGQQMVASPYLLPEDVVALGLKPFDELDMTSVCRLHQVFGKDQFKPHWEDTGLPRNEPDVEMRARAYDLMNCGFSLALDDEFPLATNSLTEGSDGTITISYVEGGKQARSAQPEPVEAQPILADAQVDQLEGQLRNLRPASRAGPNGMNGMHMVGNLGREHTRAPSGSVAVEGSPEPPMNDIGPSETESDLNIDAKMHDMVDDLLDDDGSDLMGARPGRCLTQPKTSSYGMHSSTADHVFGGLQTPGHNSGVMFGKPNPWGSFATPPQSGLGRGEPNGPQHTEVPHFSTGSPAQRASSTSSLQPNVPEFAPGLGMQRASDPFAPFPPSNAQAPGSQFGQTNFGTCGRPSSSMAGALQGNRGGFGHTRQRLGGSTGSSGASSFLSPKDNTGAYEIASGGHVSGLFNNIQAKTASSPLGFSLGSTPFSTDFSQTASGLPPVNSPFGLPTGQINGGFAQGDMFSYNQQFAGPFPTYGQPNDLTTVCNGNVYNATTAYGRGIMAAKDDPSHFRNAVKKTHMGVAAAEADAFDRAVLESALAEDRPKPKG